MNFKSDREKINILRSFINNPIQKEKNPKIITSIEWLLEEHTKLKSENEKLNAVIEYNLAICENNYISKKKILSKIKELEETMKAICEKEDAEDYQCEEYYKIQVLKELLGGNE